MRRMEDSDLFVDLCERRGDGDAIKWHRHAGMSRQHERVRGEREQLVQAMVECGSASLRLLRICLQVGAPDPCRKEGISGKKRLVIQKVAGAFHRVAWRVESRERQSGQSYRVAIADCSERVGNSLLIRQPEHRAAAFGELART